MDAVQRAKSGHPGLPMGAAAMAVALWTRHLRFNPKNPKWFNRDRFILSAGHGSMLIYSLLHLTGFDVSLEDLKQFRQLHSKTAGHPENTLTPGVEMATGPLGQGFAHGVGMAIAEKFLAATYNRSGFEVIDHFTYAIVSDGDLMEGISSEAGSLAGHLKLGKLIYLYDDNGISIDGSTSLAFTENVRMRFEAFGWHVLAVDGMDVNAVDDAITASKAVTDKPSLIMCKTQIGFGSPNKAGSEKAHGAPLGPEEVVLTKRALGIPTEPEFFVPSEVKEAMDRSELGEHWEEGDGNRMKRYAQEFPELAAELTNAIRGKLPSGWKEGLPVFTESMATRKYGQAVLAHLGTILPTLIGGSADLADSTFTHLPHTEAFQANSPAGRNLHFGVRELAMAAAVNGIELHGGARAIASSFVQFTDYARPAIRLAALMECPSIFVFTHDSIGLGEDGPTHQPVEHIASLRAIPNLNTIRPCDGAETAVAYAMAIESKSSPTMILLTRQNVPVLSAPYTGDHPAYRGGYVLKEASNGAPSVILIGTGSEVGLCAQAAQELESQGVPTRVVSLPSWFVFEMQSLEYRNSVLPKDVPAVAVEAGSSLGWAKYAQAQVCLDRFGASAPASELFVEFGFTPENIVEKAKQLVK
jgi:transketolase